MIPREDSEQQQRMELDQAPAIHLDLLDMDRQLQQLGRGPSSAVYSRPHSLVSLGFLLHLLMSSPSRGKRLCLLRKWSEALLAFLLVAESVNLDKQPIPGFPRSG